MNAPSHRVQRDAEQLAALARTILAALPAQEAHAALDLVRWFLRVYLGASALCTGCGPGSPVTRNIGDVDARATLRDGFALADTAACAVALDAYGHTAFALCCALTGYDPCTLARDLGVLCAGTERRRALRALRAAQFGPWCASAQGVG